MGVKSHPASAFYLSFLGSRCRELSKTIGSVRCLLIEQRTELQRAKAYRRIWRTVGLTSFQNDAVESL